MSSLSDGDQRRHSHLRAPWPRDVWGFTPHGGQRVVLVSHTDDHSPLQPGTIGTVGIIDSLGTVHIAWDDGSQLGMIPGQDVIRPAEAGEG